MLFNPTRSSVVICAYSDARRAELDSAIASVRAQTQIPQELIVVIDHNPRLYERVRDTFRDVRVLENRHARGLSGARNSGITVAQGEWIAFLDEDAAAAPDWLERLSVGYADPDVLGVGGAIEPQWQTVRPSWFPEEFDWVVGCTYRGMPRQAEPVRNLIGCNMSFRRELFANFGGFRSGIGRIGTLPLGCEETEFCIRVSKRRGRGIFLYDPRSKVYHTVPPQRGTWKYFFARCYAEGLSKAQVADLLGARDALSSERRYLSVTLRDGFLSNIAFALRHADGSGLMRAGAIIGGLLMTAAGYACGKVKPRPANVEDFGIEFDAV